jgi:prepilin-type N-terminal cleavage/methylation domain-containing protein
MLLILISSNFKNATISLFSCLSRDKRHSAFTLAEVLITLLIIGVIASIVIPGLIQDTQQAEFKTAWKKSFADLSAATKMLMVNNDGTFDGLTSSAVQTINLYSNELKYTKKCYNPDVLGNCWHNSGTWYFLNGTPLQSSGSGSNIINTDYAGLILANGQLLTVPYGWSSKNCSIHGFTGDGTCTTLMIDVNGFKKPNILGKDIFYMEAKKTGLVPAGATPDVPMDQWCDSVGTIGLPGLGCSAKYLKE